HFLHDRRTLDNIAQAIRPQAGETLLEIGPGRGALTRLLVAKHAPLTVVETDGEFIAPLRAEFPEVRVVEADFLRTSLKAEYWCGNLPYNISSPILFKLLEERRTVREAVFMLQKEVARRICAPAGGKDYGVLSVLLGRYYSIEYLFEVGPGAFVPPPKVRSAVIRLTRNERSPDGYEKLRTTVKAAFARRRKTLLNAMRSAGLEYVVPEPWRGRRAEELNVEEFAFMAERLNDENAARP
ncbi:MAG: 16S rRNA (adenine(1518)-N(6)/adenine(1519)-N(6))-dimethyltransferase RsmA, partial [Bacteroidia bacterium]|nr:16S rRNA (adenine(1518)-N(6)/adenine(1519)-N(6))-dimethyltransferase RsmA [Bacteroidia bacterium]